MSKKPRGRKQTAHHTSQKWTLERYKRAVLEFGEMSDALVNAMHEAEETILNAGIADDPAQYILLSVLQAHTLLTGDGLDEDNWHFMVKLVLSHGQWHPHEQCPYTREDMIHALFPEEENDSEKVD